MSKLIFGDSLAIKEIKEKSIREWLKEHIENILQDCEIEHVGECPHCGQSMECDSSDFEYEIKCINDVLQVMATCSECEFEFEFTINKFSEALEDDEYKFELHEGIIALNAIDKNQLSLEGMNAVG